MKRFPMMFQLSLILFIVMAVPTGILTGYSGKQILGNSEHEIAESSLAGLIANRKLNENALNNLSQDTVRLTATPIFDRIRPFKTYAELSAKWDNVRQAMAVLQELTNLNRRVDGVYSSFFYLQGSDYVVSTDRSITKLDMYEPIDWIQEALTGRKGIGGVWYPRKLSSGVHVVSYVLPLNRLTTTTKGTIVVNLKESQLEEYLRSTDAANRGYRLLEPDGTIISDNHKDRLLADGNDDPFIRELLQNRQGEGYAFQEAGGERLLYTWSRSKQLGWMNISIYSMSDLLSKTHNQQRGIFLFTSVIIFLGTLLAVFLATWLSKPARELVRLIRSRGKPTVWNKNELVFLESAFRRMQEEEEELQKLLREREQDTRSYAVHNLLRGEIPPKVSEFFPGPRFLVAVISIDRYRGYTAKTNSETRSYHRYLLGTFCESLFKEKMTAQCVYQGEGCFALVLNSEQTNEENPREDIHPALVGIRDKAAELLGHTVTIGVSSPADDVSLISERAGEAMEVLKRRMTEGPGGIHYWSGEGSLENKYIYPAQSERRILNFLDAGDLGSIIKELRLIRNEIQAAKTVSYDNILFIYNQLVGVSIKHLRENNGSTARIMAGRGNIYSILASLDTLDDLEEYLHEFYAEIIRCSEQKPGELTHYGERITDYLKTHFCGEVVFEEMAKEIGISYSYMRKIVYEMTGTSLIDYLNKLRIEKAKQLLLENKLTIKQVAAEVGYENARSFNRFFHKYEGMPPSSYRTWKRQSEQSNTPKASNGFEGRI